MTPYRQAHRPPPRWRHRVLDLVELLVETVIIGALFIAVIFIAGLSR